MTYQAECYVCRNPITWQEINSGDAHRSDEGVAHKNCVSEEVDTAGSGDNDDFGNLETSIPV